MDTKTAELLTKMSEADKELLLEKIRLNVAARRLMGKPEAANTVLLTETVAMLKGDNVASRTQSQRKCCRSGRVRVVATGAEYLGHLGLGPIDEYEEQQVLVLGQSCYNFPLDITGGPETARGDERIEI